MSNTTETRNTAMITGSYITLVNERISDLIISKETIAGCKYDNSVFENILFLDCDFQGTEITSCKFIDCEFINCNFNFMKLNNCSLITSRIENCEFCITNSLNCNFLSCSYIENRWEESHSTNSQFSNCFMDEAGIVPEFKEETFISENLVYELAA